MRCPHCQRDIPDHQIGIMAQRTPPGEPLPDHMRRLGAAGLYLIAIVMLAGLLAIAKHAGLPV